MENELPTLEYVLNREDSGFFRPQVEIYRKLGNKGRLLDKTEIIELSLNKINGERNNFMLSAYVSPVNNNGELVGDGSYKWLMDGGDEVYFHPRTRDAWLDFIGNGNYFNVRKKDLEESEQKLGGNDILPMIAGNSVEELVLPGDERYERLFTKYLELNNADYPRIAIINHPSDMIDEAEFMFLEIVDEIAEADRIKVKR